MANVSFSHRDFRTTHRPLEWTPRILGAQPQVFMRRETATLESIIKTGSRNILLCGEGMGLPDGFDRAASKADVKVEPIAGGHTLILSRQMQIYVRWARDWFGADVSADVEASRTAWAELLELLKLHTKTNDGRWLMPLPSPAMTGVAFFRTYMPTDMIFARLTPEQRTIIMSSWKDRWHTYAPDQHRDEIFKTMGTLPECWYFDHSHFYRTVGISISLPEGEIEEQIGGDFRIFKPGWYLVSARVPDDWKHVALVASNGEWVRTPGQSFEAWVAEPEARLLFNYKDTWRPVIKRQLRFALNGGSDRQGLRTAIEIIAAIEDAGKTIPGIRYACRAILHHAIGKLHPGYRPVKEDIHEDDDARLDAAEAAGAKVWRNQKKPAYWTAEYPNTREDRTRDEAPQISAHLWSEARRRMAVAMLSVPFDDIIGVFSDAIFTTRPHDFPSHGNDPAFNRKGYRQGPVKAPKNTKELRAMFAEISA